LDWFFRRTALYDTEAYVYFVGILYEEPAERLPLESYYPDATTSPEGDGCVSSAPPLTRAFPLSLAIPMLMVAHWN
jgi:hypothetical protein